MDSAGPSTGNILLSPDKRRLVWDVGQCINNFRIYLFVGFYSQGIAETIPPEILPKKKSAHIRRGKYEADSHENSCQIPTEPTHARFARQFEFHELYRWWGSANESLLADPSVLTQNTTQ